MNVVATGNLETATDNTIFEQLSIKNENEALMHGEHVDVMLLDEHYDHIAEHRALVSDPAMRKDAELLQMVIEHIQKHLDILKAPENASMLMAFGMQPIQEAPPAPPAGGQPGPAGTPNPSALPPVDQAIEQTGAEPQAGPQMPAGFENSPVTAEQNLAKIQGE
jgi:hypothetical protein